MIAALLVLVLAMEAAAAVATHGDWTVGCDNRRVCEALSRVPEGGADADYPLVVLRRDAAPAAPAALELPIPAGIAAGTRLSLAVDGRTIAELVAPGGGAGLALPFTGTLASAITRGRVLTLADQRRRVRARASLAGLGAALTAIDTAQGRTGTRTALLRPGRSTADAVPPAPPLSVIDQPEVTGRPARTLSRAQLARLTDPARAGCGAALPRSYRLDARHSLLALEARCGDAASTWLFVVPEKGAPVAATFDVPAADPPSHRVNGAWDPVGRRIATLLPAHPGRDCGTLREFAWDGARFRLARERVVAECRRTTHHITTWQARVAVH